MKSSVIAAVAAASIVLVHASPAIALPTMIRLGYIDCASCHYSPQGGGPLNPYGRGIDEAQSLRAGEYRPRDNKLVRIISWNGRIAQDLRLVFPMQRAWASHESSSSFRPRLLYRNFTELPQGFAVHLTLTGETDDLPRPTAAYDPRPGTSSPIVNVALLRFRVLPAVDVYGGRDQLPSGVNIPDLGAFIRQRNRFGFYDTPAQIKMNWAGKRFRVVPFAYGPGGNEAAGEGESGGGTLAEVDPFGTHHVVVGLNLLRGSADNGDRAMVGAHARLGFGRWGILAEHDVTSRTREDVAEPFRQHASYGQAFWAVQEWLVASLIGERLSLEQPYEERINSGRIEIATRLTSVATMTLSMGIQHDLLTDRTSKSLVFQVALKTVY
jgi:hypothetical protein